METINLILEQSQNIATAATNLVTSIDICMPMIAEPEPEPTTCEICRCTW